MRIAIIGAGPYGMSVAAHLQAAGLEPVVFGEPMSFWGRHMPRGMCLRSFWEATHISAPGGRLSLDAFQRQVAIPIGRPIPLDAFIDYGHWFAETGSLPIDRRHVDAVEPAAGAFRLHLADASTEVFDKVVIAAGISSFANLPPEACRLPSHLASHSSEYDDFAKFDGCKVLVVGGGQSALESAALLAESGANVEVLVRRPVVHWLKEHRASRAWLRSSRNPLRPLLAPPSTIGPVGISLLVDKPELFRSIPSHEL